MIDELVDDEARLSVSLRRIDSSDDEERLHPPDRLHGGERSEDAERPFREHYGPRDAKKVFREGSWREASEVSARRESS